MRTTFADPKTDFVFKRIFGTVAHKGLLIQLLNTLLELEGDHLITDLKYLSQEQRVPIEELKLSLVDVKCFDQTGRHYVVEMQVLNVEGFEKRIVYNTAKAYVTQLRTGEDYPRLDDVVGVTICDFLLWPRSSEPDGPPVPMLSRWRMQEQHGGARGSPRSGSMCSWNYPSTLPATPRNSFSTAGSMFFREAENLEVIPEALNGPPFREALEVARVASFSAGELDLYDRAKIAEQDARGASAWLAARATRRGVPRDVSRVAPRDVPRDVPRGFGWPSGACARCWVSHSTQSALPPSKPWRRRSWRRSPNGSAASAPGPEWMLPTTPRHKDRAP